MLWCTLSTESKHWALARYSGVPEKKRRNWKSREQQEASKRYYVCAEQCEYVWVFRLTVNSPDSVVSYMYNLLVYKQIAIAKINKSTHTLTLAHAYTNTHYFTVAWALPSFLLLCNYATTTIPNTSSLSSPHSVFFALVWLVFFS